ncbi:membrane protein insertion efficiency factor YidD [Nitrosophilus labii]|uniref:membrane protein insertion efficiency factor YidD n=1 Tax=Nitrosophilus labii TaxID=2706014 RepID=UPI00165702D7|nr:membrane protein insertion efficiency factor YidD [Nitrosophilus labii]
MVKKLFLKLLVFYQKFLSVISPGSCRYYPTCSEYAKWRIENENVFKAIFFIVLRILRCNQLFAGGIEYPIITKKLDCIKKRDAINIKYWLIPKDKNRYYLIKNFSKTKV